MIGTVPSAVRSSRAATFAVPVLALPVIVACITCPQVPAGQVPTQWSPASWMVVPAAVEAVPGTLAAGVQAK